MPQRCEHTLGPSPKERTSMRAEHYPAPGTDSDLGCNDGMQTELFGSTEPPFASLTPAGGAPPSTAHGSAGIRRIAQQSRKDAQGDAIPIGSAPSASANAGANGEQSASHASQLIEAIRLNRAMRLERPGEMTWIYAIQAGEGGPIKIGKTNSPATRIRTLQQANSADLIGRAAWRAFAFEERQLHEEFAEHRIRGEWFRPAPELLDLVLALGGDFEDWTIDRDAE